jgi:2-dehydro-3-deoxygalactonokinase
MTKTPAWIAVDWGTSRLRAWAMASDGVALEERASDDGMGRLAPDDFEAALLNVIGDWLGQGPINIVACGMVGARQGWREAAYLAVPNRPHGGAFTRPLTLDDRLNVHILPGMMQTGPADVMRGEETQIAGYLSLHPDFDGILCLPGTHTKWVHVSAGEVVSFQTFMTGEIFALLCEKSVLRHSVQSEDINNDAFSQAVDDGIADPARLAARLFSLRAEDLVHGQDATNARSRLSGLLTGAELGAARPYWLGQAVTLIGDPKLMKLYAGALASQGVTAKQFVGDDATRAGLVAAHRKLQESLS